MALCCWGTTADRAAARRSLCSRVPAAHPPAESDSAQRACQAVGHSAMRGDEEGWLRGKQLYVPSVGSIVASDVPGAVTARGGTPTTKMKMGHLLGRNETPWTITFLLIWKVNSL